jgi:hypothetical protein
MTPFSITFSLGAFYTLVDSPTFGANRIIFPPYFIFLKLFYLSISFIKKKAVVALPGTILILFFISSAPDLEMPVFISKLAKKFNW